MFYKKISTKNLISLTLIFIFSISLIPINLDFVYAENIRDTKFEKIEKIPILKYEKVMRSDETKLLHLILLLLDNKNIDQETKQDLMPIAKNLQAKLVPIPTTYHVAEINKLLKENEKLIAAYQYDQKFAEWFDTELVGFGIDDKQELLFIDIEPSFAKQKNAIKYKEKIESFLSSTTKIEFRQIERPQNMGCNSLVSDCDPLQGGVRISVSGDDCSVGFKAKDGSDTGFITAGHCGAVNDVVKYSNYPYDKIGEVTKDGFEDGDTSTYCDCLFVKMTEDVTVDDVIFSSIDAIGIGQIISQQSVLMKGFSSGEITGDINAVTYSVLIDDVFHKRHMRIDSPPLLGDSGGPVYQIVDGKTKLLGFISAKQSGQYTIASKTTYLGYELPHVRLDFN